MDLAIPASLGAFVMAGMRLRSEGGMNFEASGGFLKWLFWGCFLLSLPGVSRWLVNESVPGAQQLVIAGASGAQYTAGIERVTNDFVSDFLIGHVVPVVAASLVFKAVLDLSQGSSPLASIIAALFLLGVQGFYNLATGSWMQSGDAYGVTDMLMSMFGYAANRISPIVGGLALSAAILNHVRHRPWGALAASGLGFLSVLGLMGADHTFCGGESVKRHVLEIGGAILLCLTAYLSYPIASSLLPPLSLFGSRTGAAAMFYDSGARPDAASKVGCCFHIFPSSV